MLDGLTQRLGERQVTDVGWANTQRLGERQMTDVGWANTEAG